MVWQSILARLRLAISDSASVVLNTAITWSDFSLLITPLVIIHSSRLTVRDSRPFNFGSLFIIITQLSIDI